MAIDRDKLEVQRLRIRRIRVWVFWFAFAITALATLADFAQFWRVREWQNVWLAQIATLIIIVLGEEIARQRDLRFEEKIAELHAKRQIAEDMLRKLQGAEEAVLTATATKGIHTH